MVDDDNLALNLFFSDEKREENVESILAVLNPKESDYYFFVADKNGKTYFSKSNSEHAAIIAELKNKGLWYTYS